MEYWADEIMDIADDETNDFVERETENGNKRVLAIMSTFSDRALRVDHSALDHVVYNVWQQGGGLRK